jgi:osmotically inducible protein OsmC
MLNRKAEAVWEGSLKEGRGKMKLASGAFEGSYSFDSRFGDGGGTNPEELIGAAHAGCFSMALSAALVRSGFKPERIFTTADVSLEKVGEGFKITKIVLTTEAVVPQIDEERFADHAEDAKQSCPVSVALSGTDIALNAKLIK